MTPVRFKFRLNVWPGQHNEVKEEISYLVSFNVSNKVRSRTFSEGLQGLQKIIDKLEGRVDEAR